MFTSASKGALGRGSPRGRHRIAADPDEKAALVAAAQRRADKLTEMSGLSPLLTEGLTVMAAGSLQPAELARGAAVALNRGRRARCEHREAPTTSTPSPGRSEPHAHAVGLDRRRSSRCGEPRR